MHLQLPTLERPGAPSGAAPGHRRQKTRTHITVYNGLWRPPPAAARQSFITRRHLLSRHRADKAVSRPPDIISPQTFGSPAGSSPHGPRNRKTADCELLLPPPQEPRCFASPDHSGFAFVGVLKCSALRRPGCPAAVNVQDSIFYRWMRTQYWTLNSRLGPQLCVPQFPGVCHYRTPLGEHLLSIQLSILFCAHINLLH